MLKEVGGTPVYIRDVAEVRFGEEVRYGAMMKDGYTESVGGIVMMIRGGNAKEVVTPRQGTRRRDQRAGHAARRPADRALLRPLRTGRRGAVDRHQGAARGRVLVVVVLFLFLGDLRSSLIVVATLVLTPLVTFIVMNRYGLSANLMSLGGLAIAIGLMVDGSVVVVENAFARLGQRPGESRGADHPRGGAARSATPVIFGIGIIILVFLPLMTLQGMEGKMFAPLAYTIAIALAISLVLSLTLTPALCSYALQGRRGARHLAARADQAPYLRLLRLALWQREEDRRRRAGCCSPASLALFPFLGTAFIPEMKEGSISPRSTACRTSRSTSPSRSRRRRCAACSRCRA